MAENRPESEDARARGGSRSLAATGLGTLAILFWGSTIGVSRSLTERVGTLTASAAILLAGGAIASVPLVLSASRRRALTRLPRAYWIACGLPFVAYMVLLYLAIGSARGRVALIVAGLINYLWPTFTLALSIPMLGKRARPALPLGIALACIGIVVAAADRGDLTWEGFLANVGPNLAPYGLALAAAACWSFYSNAARRIAGGGGASGVPVLLVASGIALAAARILTPEDASWSVPAFGELAFLAVFPTLLAYTFWERAMREGNVVAVASLSYATPILSTLVSAIYLGVAVGGGVWAGCALVAAGAGIASRSVVDRAPPGGRPLASPGT
ncbi:MAG: EamA family transporter [Planctomycetes bacterium]|nr:EamA family transporter [Planctomycetota bacterium]